MCGYSRSAARVYIILALTNGFPSGHRLHEEYLIAMLQSILQGFKVSKYRKVWHFSDHFLSLLNEIKTKTAADCREYIWSVYVYASIDAPLSLFTHSHTRYRIYLSAGSLISHRARDESFLTRIFWCPLVICWLIIGIVLREWVRDEGERERRERLYWLMYTWVREELVGSFEYE